MKIVIATHNKGKIVEFKRMLEPMGIEVVTAELSEPEETGTTFAENAFIKAESACKETGLPAVADDSGLCVDALDGAPGIYSARYCEGTDEDRNAFLLKNMQDKENRACRFVCAIACVLADGETLTVRGECEGTLLRENHGAGGFGYDPIFFYPPAGMTSAELTAEEKNAVSHRGKALRKMVALLEKEI